MQPPDQPRPNATAREYYQLGKPLTYLQVRIPPEWHEAVIRHHEHLSDLASSLSDCGVSPEVIKVQVEVVVARYREALLAAIQTNKGYLDAA